jgi:tol-pal system protein YbgF
MKLCSFLLLCLITACNTGCIPLGSNSRVINELKAELSQLQIEHRELKQNQADLYAKIESSSAAIDALNASVQDLRNEISNQPDNKSKIDYDNAVLLSSVYQSAYGDYSMGKFDIAYSGFQSFVDKYPNSEFAPQAQFYMGECFYSRKMWGQAVDEYKKVEENYNRSNFVASARLKIALCYINIGKRSAALNIFSSIVKDFPKTSEALTSKEKIKQYNNAKT